MEWIPAEHLTLTEALLLILTYNKSTQTYTTVQDFLLHYEARS